MPGYKIMVHPFEVSPTQYTRLFLELHKIEPTTTTILPPPETLSNDITEEEKLELLGDQWLQDLQNETHQSHSGWQVQEDVQNVPSESSEPKSNRSWLEKLFSSKGVSVQSSTANHLEILILTRVLASVVFP